MPKTDSDRRIAFAAITDAQKHKKVIFLKKNYGSTLSFFLEQDLSDITYEDFSEILVYIKLKYRTDLEIIGGGYGCSEIIMEVICHDAINDCIRDIAEDEELLQLMKERNIRIKFIRTSGVHAGGSGQKIRASHSGYPGPR
jgi:hypothetical protein